VAQSYCRGGILRVIVAPSIYRPSRSIGGVTISLLTETLILRKENAIIVRSDIMPGINGTKISKSAK